MQIPESISNHPGIIAAMSARAWPANVEPAFHGDTGWRALLRDSMALTTHTAKDCVRVVIGEHTILIKRHDQDLLGVVVETGHAIAKSLHRMIRRVMQGAPRGRRPASAEKVQEASQ
jgi:hypothetical protein